MKPNLSPIDRAMRLALAAAAAFGALLVGTATVFGLVLLLVAIVLVGTSLVRWCPLYAMFGFSTFRAEPAGDGVADGTPRARR